MPGPQVGCKVASKTLVAVEMHAEIARRTANPTLMAAKKMYYK